MKQRVKKRWEDHTITGIGRREARAAFYEDTSEKISLNGQWKFLYLEAPELSPEGFMNAGTDGWDEIDVPSVWKLRGYDAMIQMYYISSRFIRHMYRARIRQAFIRKT